MVGVSGRAWGFFRNAGTQLGLVKLASEADVQDQSVRSGPLGAAFDVQFAVNPNSTLLPGSAPTA